MSTQGTPATQTTRELHRSFPGYKFNSEFVKSRLDCMVSQFGHSTGSYTCLGKIHGQIYVLFPLMGADLWVHGLVKFQILHHITFPVFVLFFIMSDQKVSVLNWLILILWLSSEGVFFNTYLRFIFIIFIRSKLEHFLPVLFFKPFT